MDKTDAELHTLKTSKNDNNQKQSQNKQLMLILIKLRKQQIKENQENKINHQKKNIISIWDTINRKTR